jgi:hypothetical protein
MSMFRNTKHGSQWVSGTELIHGRPSPTFGRGRLCAASGCRTHLSAYNPDNCCSLHNHPLY